MSPTCIKAIGGTNTTTKRRHCSMGTTTIRMLDRLTQEGTGILKQRSLKYIRSQPVDNPYYIDGPGDGTRLIAAVVHKGEELIIRLNDSASVLDAAMTTIRVALENASETRETITIHTASLTAVNILNNRKLNLNNITIAIRDAAPVNWIPINWIPAHTGILGNDNTDQAAKIGLKLDIRHITVNTRTFREETKKTKMKEQMVRHYNELAYDDASQQTKDHSQLHQTDS